MNYSDKTSQFRATLEDTKKKQRLFRSTLLQLIKENRPLSSSERDKFLDLLADSNFGLGTIECVFWLKDGKKIKIDNLEKFIRDIVDWDKSVVSGDFFFFSLGNYSSYSISISEIWKNILSKCGGVNAEAIAMSVRISKEQKKTGNGRGTYVGPKDVSKFTG